MWRRLLPGLLASEPRSQPRAGCKGGNKHGGGKPHDALAPAINAATCLWTHLTMDRLRGTNRHRLPRGRCMVGAISGGGIQMSLTPLRESPGDNPTVRGQGASVAAQPLYIRAGKVCEYELGPLRAFSFTALTLPPPLCCSIRCLCLCAALCLCVCARRPLRLPRCVSTGPVAVRLAEMAI